MNEKKQLRSVLRKQYQQLDTAYLAAADEQIIIRLQNHFAFQSAKHIFLYASVDNEVNTRSLIANAYKSGKKIALPKCEDKGQMTFYEYDGRLVEGRYHIPEPASKTVLEPDCDDVMVVPGLAFDLMGYRMGQGGGYYDRYLSKFTCIRIGVCREQFILNMIPKEWNDLPVDYVITEAAVYKCKENGAS